MEISNTQSYSDEDNEGGKNTRRGGVLNCVFKNFSFSQK